MLPNLFSTSPAVWSALIGAAVALPLLIHLINLMRHKKVEWAAMDFLMKSYKKNRNWIWLKQLFLLLSRIAALLLLLFILAQLGCNDERLTQMLGGQTTHHYVLLDDSFSMGDQSDSGTAFDRALATVSKIVAKAKGRENQKLTLIRFSKTDEVSGEINAEPMDRNFDTRLQSFKSSLTTTALPVGPAPLINKVSELIKERSSENSIVYVLSDFREKDWAANSELAEPMESIADGGGRIELINCVKNRRNNLAITELQPRGNVRVAGVPLTYQLAVRNFGETAAEKIQVRIQTTTFETLEPEAEPADQDFTIDQLPTVYIDRIEAGETATRDFPVYFPNTGFQVVEAQLPDDPVRVDNVRFSTVEFQSSSKVLLINNESALNSPFVPLALNPGGMTGLQTESRPPSFLRDKSAAELAEFDAIMLLDVAELDETSVASLEAFVQIGGGVAIFLGPETSVRDFNNRLYNNGRGLAPFAIEKQVELAEPANGASDIETSAHPLFPGDPNNPLIQLVSVRKFYSPALDWRENAPETTTVAATVRGDSNWPLIVQRKLGAGNVLLFTTTATPDWNNWARNPSFPPLLLTAEDILASGRFLSTPLDAGVPVRRVYDIEKVGPKAELMLRSNAVSSESPATSGRQMAIEGNNYLLELGVDPIDDTTQAPGVLDIWLKQSDQRHRVERIAINVATQESDLAITNSENLLQVFQSSKPSYMIWDQFNPAPETAMTSDLSKLLLLLLLIVMVVEQTLAYQCSYHAKLGKSPAFGRDARNARLPASAIGGRD